MEALQGCRMAMQPSGALVDAVPASKRGTLTVRPLGCHGFALSSRRFNPLVCKVPLVNTRIRSRGVVTMSVEDSYASALAQIAKSKDALEEVYSDIERLNKYWEKPEVYKFFTNPTVPDGKKKDVFKSIAAEEKLQDYTLNFLNILVDNRRSNLIKDVLHKFEEKYYELTDTEVAVVTSAIKIGSTQLEEIAKKVKSLTGAKAVKIKNEVDPSVIAGFSVKYGPSFSNFIDLTVKGELDRLTSALDDVPEVAVGSTVAA